MGNVQVRKSILSAHCERFNELSHRSIFDLGRLQGQDFAAHTAEFVGSVRQMQFLHGLSFEEARQRTNCLVGESHVGELERL